MCSGVEVYLSAACGLLASWCQALGMTPTGQPLEGGKDKDKEGKDKSSKRKSKEGGEDKGKDKDAGSKKSKAK